MSGSGSGIVILTDDYMPVVPVITAIAEAKLRWSIDGESYQKPVNASTWEIPELELRHANYAVSITSEGIVTFVYRERRL